MNRKPPAPVPQRHLRNAIDLLCPICNKLVNVESAKTDEDGHAIHEACYVLKIKQTGPRND